MYLVLVNKRIPKSLESRLQNLGILVYPGKLDIRDVLKEIIESYAFTYSGIISVGGDSTHSKSAEVAIAENLPLIPLPYGSGNDFPRALSITDYKKFLEAIEKGNLVRKHVDVLEFYISKSDGATSRFQAIVGIHLMLPGISGDVERFPWKQIKRVLKARVYKIRGVYALIFGKASWEASIRCAEGKEERGKFYFGHIANTPTTAGGGIKIPQTRIDDGYTNILLVKDIGGNKYVQLFKYLPKLSKGPEEDERVRYLKCKKFEVRGEPLPVGYDGEFIGYTDYLRGEVKPKALEVLVYEQG